MKTEAPFEDYPDFAKVLDNISEDGFQMHYRSMRLLYADEGTRWRRKWEPTIRKWKRLAENWVSLITILRESKYNDIISTRKIAENSNDLEIQEFFRRIKNNLISLKEMEDFKKLLVEKSIDKNPIITDFINEILETETIYGKKIILNNDEEDLRKEAIINYIESLKKINPMIDISGIKMIPYEEFIRFISTIKELVEDDKTRRICSQISMSD